MSAEANVAASRRIIEEAWNRGNLAVIDQICAPDCVDHDLSTHDEIRGIEAAKERTRMYRMAMPDLRVSIDDVVASEDEVVIRWTARGTNEGELMGHAPTHRPVEMTGISIERFDAEGTLVEVWDQWDYLGFMHQVGRTPQLAQA